MSKIPSDIREWLEFGTLPSDKIETKKISELEGTEIATGISGNSISKDVSEFAEDHTDKDYLVVVITEGQDEWGSMAIPFNDRVYAEKFRELVREDGGGLRLSEGGCDEWFVFEAE